MESPVFHCFLQLIEDLNFYVLEIPGCSEKGMNPEAFEKAMTYFVTSMLEVFMQQVYGECDGDWKSWTIRFATETVRESAVAFTNEYGQLFDAKTFEDNLYSLYYKRTDDFTNSKVLTLLVEEQLLNDNVTSRIIEVGKWSNIDYMYVEDGYVWLSGDIFVPGGSTFPEACAVILNLNSAEVQMQYITEKDYFGDLITAAQGVELAFNNQYFVVTGNNNIMFLPNTFSLKLTPYESTGSRIPTNNDSSISIFPMPASDLFSVKGIDPGMPVHVFDISGKIVANGTASMVDIKHLKSGSYFVSAAGVVEKLLVVK